tara:strand:- start:1191 stop:1418 length:228 start_codon:yes stop_codon:yes gene_type:complete
MSSISVFLTDNLWTIVCLILLLIGIIKYVVATKKKDHLLENTTPDAYIPSKTFIGEKKGYVFKTTGGNTGYYLDI